MNDVKDVLAKDVQSTYEQLVFRVLDVDHKDYQAAMDGFVAICKQADLARAYVELVESNALIIQRDDDGEWPEWFCSLFGGDHVRAQELLDSAQRRFDALAAVVPEEADK